MSLVPIFGGLGSGGTVGKGVEFLGGGSTDIVDSGTSVTPTFPGDIADGDEAFAFIMRRSSITPPAGWALEAEQKTSMVHDSVDQWLSIYRKSYQGADGADVTFTQGASGRMIGHVVAVRPTGAATLAVLATTKGQFDSLNEPGSHPVQSVTATQSGQIGLSGSTCLYAEPSVDTDYTSPASHTQTTLETASQNRLCVSAKSLADAEELTGVHTHHINFHDSAEISLLVGWS